MFGSIGGGELILILIVALIVFGPRRLPEIGRKIGHALAELRGVTREFKTSLEREVELDERRKDGGEARSAGQVVRERDGSPPSGPVPRSRATGEAPGAGGDEQEGGRSGGAGGEASPQS
jgi:Tat protein translocase TatB subunit